MEKPKVPKKIPITELKKQKSLELSNIIRKKDDSDYYQMPRELPDTLKRKTSIASTRSTSEINPITISSIETTPTTSLPPLASKQNSFINDIYDVASNKIVENSNFSSGSDGFADNEEYFSNLNYMRLSDMTTKTIKKADDDKDCYYYRPKIPPKSVKNSISKPVSVINSEEYEYTLIHTFAANLDLKSTSTNKKSSKDNKDVDEDYQRSKTIKTDQNDENKNLKALIDIDDLNNECLNNFEKFESEIYFNKSNLKCADCKLSKTNWISCRYMITLCNQCAYIHNKLGHVLNDYYLIQINDLFNSNLEAHIKLSIIRLLNESGNEKFDSLIEKNPEQQKITINSNDDSFSRECLIKEKYLNKPVLTDYELHLQLFGNIRGTCASFTAYNIYLLDNLSITLIDYKTEKSLLDVAIEYKQNLQVAYLFINNFKTFSYLFSCIDCLLNSYKQMYIGELTASFDSKKKHQAAICRLDDQIFDIIKINFNLKLNSITTIQKINENDIEIQYCDENNNHENVKMLFLSFNYLNELILWQKELCKKLICNYLMKVSSLNKHKLIKLNKIFDLINSTSYEVKFVGFIDLIKNYSTDRPEQQQQQLHFDDYSESDDDYDEDYDDDKSNSSDTVKVLVIIVISKYDEFIFKRDLVILNLKSSKNLLVTHIDLRKLLRIRRNIEHLQISLDMPMHKSYTFQLSSQPQLNRWLNELNKASELDEFKGLEMQYLNKQNIPIIIENCLDFMQIKSVIIPTMENNLDSKQQKYIENLILRIEKNKLNLFNITIEQNMNIDQNMLSFLILQEFLKGTFLIPKTLFESIMKNLNDNSKLIEIFNDFCLDSYNLVFYSTFKYFLMHLFIFLNFKRSQLEDKEYTKIKKCLLNVYSKLLFHLQMLHYDSNDVNKLLNHLIENFIEIFQVNKSYLNKQFKVYEKSIETHQKVANLNYTSVSINDDTSSGSSEASFNSKTNFLITVFLFHSNSEQSYQLNVNKTFKIKQIIEQTKHKYSFIESKYWCLTEILDINNDKSSKLNVYLERILPVNSGLLDVISKWNPSFYICFKQNEIESNFKKLKANDLLKMCDKCYCIYLLNTFQNLDFHNRLRAGFVSLQQSVISIYKNIKQKDVFEENSNDSFSSVNNNENDAFNIDRPLIQMNLENCLIYRGFIASASKSASASGSSRKTLLKNEDSLNLSTDNCLTIYHLLDQQLYSICFQNSNDACKWYFNLFKLRYYPDTWCAFKSDNFPNVKPNVPMEPRISHISSSSGSFNSHDKISRISGLFKKRP